MTPKKMADALQTYAEWCGGVHDSLCPEDDTCECSVKWVNDGVNAAVNYLRGVDGGALPASEAEHTGKAEDPSDGEIRRRLHAGLKKVQVVFPERADQKGRKQ